MPNDTYTNRTRNTNAQGYIRISAGKQRDMYVHTLVAMAKIGRALESWETVEHIDGDRQNNHPDNLAVMSRRDNTIAMLKRNGSPLYNGNEASEYEDANYPYEELVGRNAQE